jgi:hypothetical protein
VSARRITPFDTSLEATRIHHELWRNRSGESRWKDAFEMNEALRCVAESTVRRRHPEYSERQVQLAVIRLRYGEELFRQAFPNENVTF